MIVSESYDSIYTGQGAKKALPAPPQERLRTDSVMTFPNFKGGRRTGLLVSRKAAARCALWTVPLDSYSRLERPTTLINS